MNASTHGYVRALRGLFSTRFMRTPQIKKLLLALTITTVLNTATYAQTLALDTTATTIGHEFSISPYPDLSNSTEDSFYGSFFGAVPAPSFTANLSSLDSFGITVNAPTGYEFAINSQSGSIGGVLSFGTPLSIWMATGWTSQTNISLPTQVSFTNYNGPSWYNNTTNASVSTNGLALLLGGSLWWSGAPQITFTSVALNIDLSSLKELGFPTADFTPGVPGTGVQDVNMDYQDVLAMGTNVDPGAAMSLVSIPEPSTYAAILGATALGFAVIRRRRLAA